RPLACPLTLVPPMVAARPVICTLSLHDALPILAQRELAVVTVDQPELEVHVLRRRADVELDVLEDHVDGVAVKPQRVLHPLRIEDRKSTRLHSSHVKVSYAVFCLKRQAGRASRR